MVNLVLIVTILYILLMIGIGFYYRDNADSESGFLVAGRSIGPWIGGGALAVTFMSTSSLLGVVSAGYRVGISWAIFGGLGAVAAFIFAMVYLGPQLRDLSVETLPEYFDARFGVQSKRVAALTIGIVMTVYLIAQVRGGALVAQYILDVSYTQGVLLVTAVFILYTLLGGMYAITLTSFIQACLLLVGVMVVSVAGIIDIGGPVAFFAQVEQNAEFYFTNSGKIGLDFGLTFAGLIFLAVLSSPHVIFRYFASKDGDTARRSAAVASLFSGMFYFAVAIPPALVALTVSGISNPDNAFLVLSQQLFSANGLVVGLIFAAILAAAMSSADAMLMNAASSLVYDLGADIFDREDEDLTPYVRGVALLIGILVALLTINPPGLILAIVIMALGLFIGAFFAPLMFGLWLDERSDSAGVAGMVSGLVTVTAIHPETGIFLPNLPSPAAGIVGVIVSTVIFFVVNQMATPLVAQNLETAD